MIPKHLVTDGPVVTKTNAPGLVWMEEHFLPLGARNDCFRSGTAP